MLHPAHGNDFQLTLLGLISIAAQTIRSVPLDLLNVCLHYGKVTSCNPEISMAYTVVLTAYAIVQQVCAVDGLPQSDSEIQALFQLWLHYVLCVAFVFVEKDQRAVEAHLPPNSAPK